MPPKASPSPAVTVTVRPDGTYYVEREPKAPKKPVVAPVVARPTNGAPSPVAVAVTATLRDLAGIATAARAAAPTLGRYGVVAAIGLGVLNAWAESKPRPVRPVLRRIQLRRIPR